MITAIDTNILLDILGKDMQYYEKSMHLLELQNEEGSLIISPMVYAEILVFFLRKEKQDKAELKLKEFLKEMCIEIVHFTEKDYAVASSAWNTFLKTKVVQCPSCGCSNNFFCKRCKKPVHWRNHILTDFLIGAHAKEHADVLATRDRGYYQKYFNIKTVG